jgi:acyl dehydratase
MPIQLDPSELGGISDKLLEPSDWLEITQERVNQFADATNDHQFIHVDPERAAASPFGGTVAHGFLTLSLIVDLVRDNMLVPAGTQVTVNYGSDKVRFIAPVRVGQKIRARQTVVDATEKKPGQWLIRTNVTIEIEGSDKPALIAEVLLMHFAG